MATFTIFCFGTWDSSSKTHDIDIISQFQASCRARAPGDTYVIDGPGVLGVEVRTNSIVAIDRIIEWLSSQNNEEEELNINLAGFSRGAVTCIHIANKLAEKIIELKKTNQDEILLKKIDKLKLNMFLLDPVAGLSDKKDKKARIIPTIVNEVTVMLQKDEGRHEFKPQDMTRLIFEDLSKTQVSLLPMYGNHTDSTKIKNDKIKFGATIAWNSLYAFLTKHGTKFVDDKIPDIIKNKKQPVALDAVQSAGELLTLFSQYHHEKHGYEASGKMIQFDDSIPIPRKKRTLNNHLKFYVKNPEFFVNQLDRESFKIVYPKTFNYFFENNQKDSRFPNDSLSRPHNVIHELRIIKNNHPALFSRLKENGFIRANGTLTSRGPKGLNYLEPCSSMQQIFPDLVPECIKNVTSKKKAMSRLSALEREVYQETFRYEREKSELSFAWDRSQSHWADAIREKIYSFATGGKDVNQKNKLILDTLEENYKDMVFKNSSSELKVILGNILLKHGREALQSKSNILAQIVHILFSALKKSVGFIGNLGYIGGGILYVVGALIEGVGRRINENIGDIGRNPLKTVLFLIGTIFQVVGKIIENSFGLKPLTEYLSRKIQDVRDVKVSEINKAYAKPAKPIPKAPVARPPPPPLPAVSVAFAQPAKVRAAHRPTNALRHSDANTGSSPHARRRR